MGPDLRETFLTELRTSVQDGTFVKLTLGKSRGGEADLQNLYIRPLTLRGAPHLSFVWRHKTNDITKNFAPAEALTQIETLVGTTFYSAHLFTTARTAQLEFNKKGEPRYSFGPAAPGETPAAEHDRVKSRLLPPTSQVWLEALGITNPAGVVRQGMADKYRQIHKYVEILSHLVVDAVLPTDRPVEIADMGCGKGYLTFATHDYFNLVAHRAANVVGIDARPELVEKCQVLAHSASCARLSFQAGTIQSAQFTTLDVLIALHACDTATDDALLQGVQAGAALIVVSPCCQKELRSQLQPAAVLAPALKHGIFQERHAEFATDALRALLLEWAGYDTKVFEFISTEHTAKNLMITATKRPGHIHNEEAAAKVRELAAFYGIKTQALAQHLGFQLQLSPMKLESLDWEVLDRLRQTFLSDAKSAGPYWHTITDLECYDLTYGERIGWKWDAVLRELKSRQWTLPAATTAGGEPCRTILDWGCGSGVAGRRVIDCFGAANFSRLLVHDHSTLAVDFAEHRARQTFPALAVNRVDTRFLRSEEPIGVLVISHVLNELNEIARAELAALLARAQTVLWVEPGTHEASRLLGEWREKLRVGGGLNVVAPCPHQGACGMFAPGNERHWCHFFAAPVPNIYADSDWVKFGQRAGIDLRSLPYSFLVLDRRPGPSADGYSRIIGEARHYKGYAKLFNCDAAGVTDLMLQKRDAPDLYKALKHAHEPGLQKWSHGNGRITRIESAEDGKNPD